ncbi:hypothetical protein RKD34_007026 [Streptomyces sp. SAI-218]
MLTEVLAGLLAVRHVVRPDDHGDLALVGGHVDRDDRDALAFGLVEAGLDGGAVQRGDDQAFDALVELVVDVGDLLGGIAVGVDRLQHVHPLGLGRLRHVVVVRLPERRGQQRQDHAHLAGAVASRTAGAAGVLGAAAPGEHERGARRHGDRADDPQSVALPHCSDGHLAAPR